MLSLKLKDYKGTIITPPQPDHSEFVCLRENDE